MPSHTHITHCHQSLPEPRLSVQPSHSSCPAGVSCCLDADSFPNTRAGPCLGPGLASTSRTAPQEAELRCARVCWRTHGGCRVHLNLLHARPHSDARHGTQRTVGVLHESLWSGLPFWLLNPTRMELCDQHQQREVEPAEQGARLQTVCPKRPVSGPYQDSVTVGLQKTSGPPAPGDRGGQPSGNSQKAQ